MAWSNQGWVNQLHVGHLVELVQDLAIRDLVQVVLDLVLGFIEVPVHNSVKVVVELGLGVLVAVLSGGVLELALCVDWACGSS